MAKRKSKKRDAENYRALIKWVSAILLIALGLILLLGAFGLAGIAGSAIFGFAFGTLGVGAFLLPVVILLIGVAIMLERMLVSPLTSAGVAIIVFSTLTLLGILTQNLQHNLGGTAGLLAGHAAEQFFGLWGALILLFALILVGVGIVTDIVVLAQSIAGIGAKAGGAIGSVRLPLRRNGETASEDDMETGEQPEEPETGSGEQPAEEHEPTITHFNRPEVMAQTSTAIPNFDAEYNAPPISLLGEDKGKPGVGDIKANANIIKRTFQNFGISVEMDEVSVGPTVTRYAIKPAEGVRLQKIIALQQNLELALAAHPVRIEAPIPGKSLVGIEVPNASKAMVGLGGVLSAPEWNTSTKPILAGLGRDIAGTPHYVNIAKMPHGLIAGATGSGKSVAIHAVITSLLYRNGPNQLRFIMVDPKRVELTLYNGIPHLLTPVITDPKKCIMALKWAAKEMDRRYTILEEEQVRDIESYHKTIFEPAKKRGKADMPEAMPYIVIVIDELADIMQTYPRELEAAIVRLAQMSRAVGIHLVLSTQRPSVNVITGLIKANVPTRMALQVSSQIDSRTILDGSGAELLLGSGDMLYQSADMQKPVRIQTAYIAEGEVKKVVSYIKQHNAGSLGALDLGAGTGGVQEMPNDAILLSDADGDVDDDLYTEAKAAVEEAGRASTSYLQRKLRIGYSRAARLMDILEEKGVIGAADGSRPRDVLSAHGAPAEPSEGPDF
ncbi:MAG TPA: DNA translocase FtsK 4TM domain-containing protein [Candidatus Paceibacterota bacterium]|jgi:S-DNA-T family DNA segregation ATPase FtsK/SpoIIIE|nr:DNA translocase FtsK 4TM domain-containing protein [Candidatus Paceibacterota bacterium]